MIKVSIITTVFNDKRFIESAIKSVLNQSYPNIEYVVKDAGSTDGTIDIIKKYGSSLSKFVSEKDKGIYDGINKAIGLTTGDIIDNLNSDDFYANKDVIKKVVEAMEKNKADVCWGDLVYVNRNNPERVMMVWKSSEYKKGKFWWGWVPPHPTFFVRRSIYEKYGLFNLDFEVAADYELMFRFLEKHKVKSCYIPETLVQMRVGGESHRTILNPLKGNWEVLKAWRVNGFKIVPFGIILKPIRRLFIVFHSFFKNSNYKEFLSMAFKSFLKKR